MNDEPVLALDDVTVEYGDESALAEALPERLKQRFGWGTDPVRAVDGVSLDVGEGDVVAIVGESGSGKTTLGKAAVGLQEPTRGQVRYRGRDVWGPDGPADEEIRRALQIVHQDPGAALNPYRSIESILEKPLKRWSSELGRADRRERILAVLREVGLIPAEDYIDRYPHELSGGEQQRIALLRAMLVEPDVVLADEPVSALDPSLRLSIMDLMLSLRDAFDTAYLFVTHNVQHARYLTEKADGRIAVMYLGEIVEIGPAAEVLDDPSHPYTETLLWATLPGHPDDAREKLAAESPLRSHDVPDLADPPSGCRFHTRCPEAREACRKATPDLGRDGTGEHAAACFRTDPDHRYWESPPLDEEATGDAAGSPGDDGDRLDGAVVEAQD